MKKIFSIFLSAVLMISCFAIAPSADTADVPFEYPLTPVFTDTFQNTNNFSITQKAATGNDENEASISIVEEQTVDYNKVLKMAVVNKNTEWYQMDVNPQKRDTLSDFDFADVLALSIDVKVEKMAGQQLALSFNYMDADNKNAGFGIYFDPDGTISFSKTGEKVSYETGKWYNVSLVVNKTKNTMYALIDGVVKYSANYTQLENPLHFGNTASSFYVEPLMIGNKSDADNVVYIDNYRTYYGEYPETNYIKNGRITLTNAKTYTFDNDNSGYTYVKASRKGTGADTSNCVYEYDSTTFEGNSVGKLTVTGGTNYTTRYIELNTTRKNSFSSLNNATLLGFSIDVNGGDLKASAAAQDFAIVPHYYNKNNTESYLETFKLKFGPAENKILIRTADEFGGTNAWREIMIEDNKWYNFKSLFDFKNNKLLLLVNDIVYSAITFEALGNNAPTLENIRGSSNKDLGLTFRYFNDVAEARTIYVDNVAYVHGNVPTEIYGLEYNKNDAVVITNRSELEGAASLGVNVNFMNNGKNAYIIANILSDNGRMVAVKLENVVFRSDEVMKSVNLIFDNLPSDIASGNYTINVMIWDNQSLESITTSKITMPDEAPTE